MHGLAEQSMAVPQEREEPEDARLHRGRDRGRRDWRLAVLYALRTVRLLRATRSGRHGQRGWRGQRQRYPYHADRTRHPHRRRCARYFTGGLSKVSAELGVTQAALANFFKILEKQKVAPEDLDSTLRDFAKRYKQLEEDLKCYTSDDPEVAALREQARAALEAGEFDRAEQLLNEASAKDLAAAERQESVARQRRLSAARSKANNGDLKWTQFAYREAAEYYRQAAALVPAEALVQRAKYLNLQGRALHEAGDYRDAEGP